MKAHPLLLAALICGRVSAARAQQHEHATFARLDSAAADFVARARTATIRYHDRSAAIADGYHQVGPDLPAMGEHWLNIAFILSDTLDPTHPPVLIYVSSPNGPVLAGLAYTRLLGARDQYPDFPRGRHAWHDHSGFIEDEALPTSHVRHSPNADTARTRLGILHLWTGVKNPAGEWTADNWALPFARAGLRTPRESDGAARALALAADSGRYYLDVFTSVGRLEQGDVERVRAVLVAMGDSVRHIAGAGGELSAEQIEALESAWRGLWPQIGNALSPAEAGRMNELKKLWW
jgi:hypothetical protein